MFNEELLDYIVCPVTRKPLLYDKANSWLISQEIGMAYPIIDGIPSLIVNESVKLCDKEIANE
jgi:uncharacterized protein YbaR (Trm112 family)